MDEITFKHFLQELKDSATTGDVQKLLVQASYFEEMTLAQQMEAGSIARLHVSPALFLRVYVVVLKNNVLARRNVVLRKLLKEAFLSDLALLREAIAIAPPSDKVAIEFITSCVGESNDSDLKHYLDEVITGVKNPLNHRVEDLEVLQKLKESGSDDSISSMLVDAGKDVGLDIVMITKLSQIHSEAAWKALTFFLGVHSSKVRGYAEAKLEEVGPSCANVLVEELDRAVSDPNPDKSIAIMTILNKVARQDTVKALRKVGRKMPNNVNMRVAFLDTIVRLDPDGSAPLLMEHVCDGVDDIAFSAAAHLDSHCNDRVVQGVQNALGSKLITLKRMVEVIVFSRAKNLAAKLSVDTAFFEELSRFCSLQGMEEYASFFGLAEPLVGTTAEIASVWAVDDSRMILRMYDRFAIEAGVVLKTFESGELLVNSMDSERPRLIFVDLNMPGMNGVGVAKKLNTKGWGDVPRVLVTTQEDSVLDEEIRNGLFNEIVLKPFTTNILTNVANRYL